MLFGRKNCVTVMIKYLKNGFNHLLPFLITIKMADLLTQIANVKSLLAFLENQLPKEEVVEKPKKETKKKDEKPVEEKPKKETKKKAEEKPVEEKKKGPNVPRVTDKHKNLLAKNLKELANTDIDDKIVDKFKKYINTDMTSEKFESDSLEDHIANFVRLNFAKKESASPFVGDNEPPACDWSNASEYPPLHKLQKTVSQEQFDAMKNSKILKPLGDGNYWSPEDGMWILVDGDDDEVTEKEFNGETYFVCKSNKRVYQTDEKTDKDLFVGFIGIGGFKNMVV